MGYLGTICQLCGVAFGIARIRSAHEPYESAWEYNSPRDGTAFVNADSTCGGDSGCQSFQREGEEEEEHVAGPGCYATEGYSGYRLSVEEMAGCRTQQTLLGKGEDWQEEDDDQEFEKTSSYFLTGLSDESTDEGPATELESVRHGVDEVWALNFSDSGFEDEQGLPFHPTCFEIFKKVSIDRLGTIDVHGLWSWRDLEGSYEDFLAFPRSNAVKNGNQQYWEHEPGHEYLAANPVKIRGFSALLRTMSRPYSTTDGVFSFVYKSPGARRKCMHLTPPPTKKMDLFSGLPNEIRYMIIGHLSAEDIANLRLVTPAYRQIPFSVFRTLLLNEMPWLWEAHDLHVSDTDWFSLYKKVKFAWQDLNGLLNRKRIWKDVNEIVTRIEKYRSAGDIGDEFSDDCYPKFK